MLFGVTMHAKAYRALGIVWTLVCVLMVALAWRSIPDLLLLDDYRFSPGLCILVFTCLFYVTGGVASVALFRGAAWASKFVGAVAGLSFLLSSLAIVAQVGFSWMILFVFLAILSLPSAIVLLSRARLAEPGASQNGGAAERLGNSGDGGGPPSVS